jgi:hypothetical protein
MEGTWARYERDMAEYLLKSFVGNRHGWWTCGESIDDDGSLSGLKMKAATAGDAKAR